MIEQAFDLELGQRYRNARSSAFGTPLQIIWVLEDVWNGADGITYARLMKHGDATEKKTVSTAVLQDRRQFVRLAE